MRVIQVWFGPIPNFILRCINSLARFSENERVDHILYVDELKEVDPYIKQVLIKDRLTDLESEYKFVYNATKADLLRYQLLSESEEYTYYVDSDCYFFKNPFEYLLVNKANDTYFYETPRKSYVNNGVVGVVPSSLIMSEVLSRATTKLKTARTLRNMWLIGPEFLTDIVFSHEELCTRESHHHMYQVNMSKLEKFYSDESELNLISILNELKKVETCGIHFFKSNKRDKQAVAVSIEKIIDRIEVMTF